ncbi:MAG: NAD(P)H-binding protein [Pseudomonadota bacterium]
MSAGPRSGRRVFVLGATGTIGRAVVAELLASRYDVTCLVRRRTGTAGSLGRAEVQDRLSGAAVRFGNPIDGASLARDGFAGDRYDVLVSCLASRTGHPADAWAVDYQGHVAALAAAQQAGVQHMVLLSAICVQWPQLAFQHAKLKFEQELMQSGLRYAIVRPTAYFKSLSGQLKRVQDGKPYLLIGDGQLTACKPISDRDLARYIVNCLEDPSCQNAVLPIGGPGPAITPLEQGRQLFRMVGRKPKFRHVPVAMLDGIVGALSVLGRVSPALADKAELARIGRYYATQSMLVRDPETGRYNADVTPSFGSDRLFDYYAELLSGRLSDDRGDHAVF